MPSTPAEKHNWREIASSSGLVLEIAVPAGLRAEHLPFTYDGINEPAHCYLRYEYKGGRLLIVVGQLPRYLGTDVTTGILDIIQACIKALVQRPEISYRIRPVAQWQGLVRRLRRRSVPEVDQSVKQNAITELVLNADLVVYYPPGVGLLETEACAVVRVENGQPTFQYRHRDILARHLGAALEDLAVTQVQMDACSDQVPLSLRAEA